MDINTQYIHNHNQTKLNNEYIIYHQNVRSLKNKVDEPLSHLYPDLPHFICLTEHHMNITEIKFLNLENYNLGAQFCRIANGKGGAITYIHNSLKFTTTELDKYSKEKDIEICGVKLKVNSLKYT
jgi:hypothetical protein